VGRAVIITGVLNGRGRGVLVGVLAVAVGVRIDAQIPASAYPARRAAAMARLGRDILIVPARASLMAADQPSFLQAPDFQYLTGLESVLGSILVLDGMTSTAVLFVAPAPAARDGVVRTVADSARSLQLSDVLPVSALEPWLRNRFEGAGRTAYVASTDERGAVSAPLPMARSILRWRSWLMTLGAADVKSAASILSAMREIKDEAELSILRRVARASRDAALAGIRAVAPGKWEHDSELAVVNACRAAGVRGISFWPWTLSGPNAASPALSNSFLAYDHLDRQMAAGEVVRVDVGCQLDHYMGDVGRTVPVSGVFTAGQREAWDLFIAGYRAGFPRIRDGATVSSVFEAILAEVRRRSTSLTTAQGKRASEQLLGPHGTDAWAFHGVGLDDAEGVPTVLRTGMIVAYELMFTVDTDAFYLEDMIAVTNGGFELLTPALPYSAEEIQAFMAPRGPKR
jgi:Xaa-Pro aminopeptidase